MAGRPKKAETDYKVSLRKVGTYRYASSHPYVTDEKTGQTIRRYVNWGELTEDLKFIPFDRYVIATDEERNRLIFPDEWDMSMVKLIIPSKMTASDTEKKETVLDPYIKNDGSAFSGTVLTSPVTGQFNNRFYGGPWLLWGIAVNKHVVEDLLITFDHQQSMVNDVLSLAMFPILTRWSYAQTERWQAYTKTPSNHPLSLPFITRFTQAITDSHRMNFLKLRIQRQKPKAVVACNSTSRSAYGRCLADIRWGKNKDNSSLQNTLEVVVYSIDTHEPIYYRSFVGNENDGRTLRTIIADLVALGCEELIVIFDRGYESEENILEMIRADQPFLVCGKVGQKPAYNSIGKVRYTKLGIPLNLKRFGDEHLYAGQFEEEYEYLSNPEDSESKVTVKVKINLYCDLIRRVRELDEIHTKMLDEEEELTSLRGTTITKSRLTELKKKCKFHSLKLDKEGILIVTKNDKAIEKAENIAGFFASIAYKIDGDAIAHYELYELRDVQEKYFEEMKDQLGFNMQNNWSEEGKEGRRFILFIGLIIHTTVRCTWKDKLRDKYPSSMDVIHEMVPIRFVEYEDGSTHVTSFTTPQAEISEAFGLPIPEDCLSEYQKQTLDRKRSPKKRGRPKGSTNKN